MTFIPKTFLTPSGAVARGAACACLLVCALLPLPAWAGQHSGIALKTKSQRTSSVILARPSNPPVSLCVVVRNATGQTVPNLRASDFRLYDNNRLQHIADFGANLIPVAVAKPTIPATPRYTALYLDDLHFDFTETIRTTDSAYIALVPTLGPHHLIGVFTSSGETTLNFTASRERFHKALLAIRPHLPPARGAVACPHLTDYQAYLLLYLHDPLALKVAFYDMHHCNDVKSLTDPPLPPPTLAEMQQMKAVVDEQAGKLITEDNSRSQRTLCQLDLLISEVATLPDPRSIIVASPGFLTGTLGRRVDELARRATKLHIILNTLNTAGLVRQLPLPPPEGRSRLRAERSAIIDAKNEMATDRAGAASDPLADLATVTGGNFVTNMDDLDEGFKEAASLPRAYYVLGYFPNNLRPDGRFHSLRVTVTGRKSLGVQAPAGYFAPGTPPELAASSIRRRHSRYRRRRRP